MQYEKDHDSLAHRLTQMLIKLNSGENAAGARSTPRNTKQLAGGGLLISCLEEW